MDTPDVPRSVASPPSHATGRNQPSAPLHGAAALRARLAEFAACSDASHPALRRLAGWPVVRARAAQRVDAVEQARRDGRDLREVAWYALLPHADSPIARARSAFIHPCPNVPDDLRASLVDQLGDEAAARLARGLADLVRTSLEDPPAHWTAVEEFAALPGAASLDAAALSPILHALRPDAFVLVDAAAAAWISLLTGRRLSTSLDDWAALNAESLTLIAACADAFDGPDLSSRVPADILHALAHWTPVEASDPGARRTASTASGDGSRSVTVTMPDGGRLNLPARSRLIIEVGTEHALRIEVCGAD